MDIQKIVDELKYKGLKDEELIKALEQMVAEDKITTEDLDNAKEYLANLDEREKAQKLFDVKFN